MFEKEDVHWDGRDISALIRKLATLTKMDHFAHGVFQLHPQDKDVIVATFLYNNETVVGIFNVGNETGTVTVALEDGVYEDLLSKDTVEVANHTVTIAANPVIFVI